MASTYITIPAATEDTAGVTSFTSRDGNVVGAAGDYEADQITFDNSASGYAATDAQAAIDEAAAAVDSAQTQLDAINPEPSVLLATAMTEAARDALTPAKGWIIFNDDTNKLQVYNGTIWVDLH